MLIEVSIWVPAQERGLRLVRNVLLTPVQELCDNLTQLLSILGQRLKELQNPRVVEVIVTLRRRHRRKLGNCVPNSIIRFHLL